MAKKQKQVTVTTTVSDAVNTAYSVIEELAGEMREAFDNTPESLQSSGVGEARGQAADELENISEPEAPEGDIGGLPVEFSQTPLKAKASRSARLTDGLAYAYAAIDVLNTWMEEHDTTPPHPQHDDVDTYLDAIQEMIDEAEAVTFPGMYG